MYRRLDREDLDEEKDGVLRSVEDERLDRGEGGGNWSMGLKSNLLSVKADGRRNEDKEDRALSGARLNMDEEDWRLDNSGNEDARRPLNCERGSDDWDESERLFGDPNNSYPYPLGADDEELLKSSQ